MIENDKKSHPSGTNFCPSGSGKEEKVPCFYFDVLDWRETDMENVFFFSVLQKEEEEEEVSYLFEMIFKTSISLLFKIYF